MNQKHSPSRFLIQRAGLFAALAALSVCATSAFAQSVTANWQSDGSGNFNNGNWSEADNWNPQVVPNNSGGTVYDVNVPYVSGPAGAQFAGPELDINVTVNNLTFVNRVFLDNQGNPGTNLTVNGTFNSTTTAGHNGENAALFNDAGTWNLGTLANYNSASHTLNDVFFYAINGGTFGWHGADIVTNNATIFFTGATSRMIDQDTGLSAIRNFAVNNGGFSISNGFTFTTAGDFTNTGGVSLGNDNSSNTRMSVTGSYTNYDASTHTLGGGGLDVEVAADTTGTSNLRFNNVDVQTNNAFITLKGIGASITDQNGLDVFRNLSVNDGGFAIGEGYNFTTAGDFTNNGSLAVTSTSDQSSTFTVTGNLTNYDAASHTLNGGSYDVEASGSGSANLRFNNAGIQNISNATVIVKGANASITDLSGVNVFTHLTTIQSSNVTTGGTYTITPSTITPSAAALTVTDSTHTIDTDASLTVNADYAMSNSTLSLSAPQNSNTQFTVTGHMSVDNSNVNLNGTPPSFATIRTSVTAAPTAILTVQNGLQLTGNSSITGTGTVVANTTITSGTISPGHSAGALAFNGALTLTSGATLSMELGGTTPGSGYDTITQSGSFQLTLGGTLIINFINGFQNTITPSATFDIVHSDQTIIGNFNNVTSGQRLATADGFGSFVVSYSGTSDVILSDYMAVPEPSAPLLLLLGTGAAFVFHRREPAAG